MQGRTTLTTGAEEAVVYTPKLKASLISGQKDAPQPSAPATPRMAQPPASRQSHAELPSPGGPRCFAKLKAL